MIIFETKIISIGNTDKELVAAKVKEIVYSGFSGKKRDQAVTIFIPSKDKNGKHVGEEKFKRLVDATLKMLGDKFGGAFSGKGRGCWRLPDGTLQMENVERCYSNTTGLSEEALEEIVEFCLFIKRDLNQNVVGFEINNNSFII